MNITCTVINNQDILLIPGEVVELEMPTMPLLPVSVLSEEGSHMGYLGRNDKTMVPGSTTGQDLVRYMEEWEIASAIVQSLTHYHTPEQKVVLDIELARRDALVLA